MLQKLADARERQARAMKRFALARARVSLAEELRKVRQAILDGTLSGPEAENALREAENALFQVQRAEIEAKTNLEADTSGVQDTSETDTTARLPIIRQRRPQESR